MKKFKIGVIVDSFKTDFKTGVELASKLGADGIQMYMVSGELAPENMSPDKIKEIQDILSKNNIEVSAVCADLGGHGFTVETDNPEKILKSKRILDLAKETGTKIITTHIGVIPSSSDHPRYKVLQEACKELGEYAYSKDMNFAIETGPETAVTLKEFLDSLDCGGMKVNMDPANFVMVTGQDPVEAVHVLKDYIVHTHAKDGKMLKKSDPEIVYNIFAQGGIGDINLNDYFIETPLGQGQVDFDKYLEALTAIGYNGYLTIEREVGDDPYGDIQLAVDLLNSKIN